jgi:rhodanese-related sulfurtransferase
MCSMDHSPVGGLFLMALLDAVKKMLGASPAQTSGSTPAPAPQPEPEPFIVPEIMAAELMGVGEAARPFLLDCRELYERRGGFIPGSVHIPMREIPYRLAALDPAADLVVYCAHGHRSHDVAGWLIERGFRARSLRGGIAAWQMQGGPVTREG